MSSKPVTRLDFAVRGLLVGAGVGALAGLLFLDMGRAVVLGGLCGCLAGITIYSRRHG